ncbi:colanic acid biosynthesis pyruvyl transferase WcaK [Klebsiella pneumoniae]|uniref:colanic acid biosynthesis pyruvyl transferase WcaK n=1 Tax=Klebsiella pneumoniae TaxID=573 RepID=UPI000446B16B|nr:colanic acid biosynthesis pyruvyl transferase WcaK [Klebsiella pneumoniae]EKZ9586396.1 colanic acid biosynthesis pyruvyl transferase WcaK [Klebsiella pneumoniae]EWE14641.1 hypothetical protein P807_02508 [Klebsiella pneumoniae BIDMC 46b]MCS6675877.1 colanic acid biosynthesis pyruvyl transferase WcaK [Klebsiella pneumoniae subsp. pneumoniae]MEB5845792.1 colanic acid biosynthesis pyruvyl transferase WcaK [Klebsiella pneumoniae]SYS94261.1 colanic acid biosynthesis protein [Klebsiella pneumonia
MKILLVGNHTCGNRGDGAILRGLVDSIKQINPDVEVDILSRYARSSAFLLGTAIKQDVLYSSRMNKNGGLVKKVIWKIKNTILPDILVSHAKGKGFLKYFPLPNNVVEFIKDLEKYDAVIQVGGSFFVDLYGTGQFEHILCSNIAGKPIYLVGHSVGPFENPKFQHIAKYCFTKAEKIILREDVSLSLMEKDNFNLNNVTLGVDTAFLVDTEKDVNDYAVSHWKKIIKEQKTVALTVRKLAPFDKRLGVSQDEYEASIARIVDYLNQLGYQVIIFSTCTGIESYHSDDRMVALSVKNKVHDSQCCHVVMDEFNDYQLGILLSNCVFTIGTRLHSAIISINFGTPAIAINYEHKSLGVMRGLKMDVLSADVSDVIDGTLINKIEDLIANMADIENSLKNNLQDAKIIGRTMIENILSEIDR